MNSQTNRFPVFIHKLLVHVADDGERYAMNAITINVPISFCSHEFTSCYTHPDTISNNNSMHCDVY